MAREGADTSNDPFSDAQCSAILEWAVWGGVPPLSEMGMKSDNCALSASKFEHGQSNPTYLITVSRSTQGPTNLFKFVLRARPGGKLLRGAHRIDREFKVLSALGMSSVPVPQVYGYCDDPKVIGSSFYTMEYLQGRVFKDVSLRDVVSAKERADIYEEALRVLLCMRNVDTAQLGLRSLSKAATPWIDRQIATWYNQFRASRIDGASYSAMESLHRRLVKRLQVRAEKERVSQSRQSSRATSYGLVHGDFRLDNLIFHPSKPVCLGVLDWELVSLGDPIADFASFLAPYHMPAEASRLKILQSAAFSHPSPAGIPAEESLILGYIRHSKVQKSHFQSELTLYLAVALFRVAAILYGVQSRAVQGNAASTWAADIGKQAHYFITGTMRILDQVITGEAVREDDSTGNGSCLSTLEEQLWRFMEQDVLPLEGDYLKHVSSDMRWTPWAPLETLKDKAKKVGLWNFFLPRDLGGKLSALQYASLAEITGRCVYAAEVFNCSAPDTGNMELLARFGTAEQKDTWLLPLLKGEIRSCFAMTEPEVASSDATNISTKIEKTDNGYRISGRKWWISGAMDPRCKVALLLGRGPNDTENRHRQHSIILIPMDTAGVRVIRPLTVFGFDDAPHGHAEMLFDGVIVPHTALLHTAGGGFEAAQSRLGGGRLHHCMRMVGLAERALSLMIGRAKERKAFDKPLLRNDAALQTIGECRCDVDAMRAVVRAAAEAVDTGRADAARRGVGVAKVVVPRLAVSVVDRAIQMHGGLGVCQDSVLGLMFAHARSLRIADGPDEVHVRNMARSETRARL